MDNYTNSYGGSRYRSAPHLSVSSVRPERYDLELGLLGQQGGLAKMYQLFGEEMDTLIDELNETLAA